MHFSPNLSDIFAAIKNKELEQNVSISELVSVYNDF